MTEITKDQIAQHAKEAGLYMTSEERIAAVERVAKAIQAQTRRETLDMAIVHFAKTGFGDEVSIGTIQNELESLK